MAFASLLCACGEEPPREAPLATAGPLLPSVAARVADDEISVDSLRRIAVTQQVSPERAGELAVRDALFSVEARMRNLGRSAQVQSQISGVLARRLLRQLLDEATRAGPVTGDELAIATERHWLEFDRPEGFRTVHALVSLDPDADASKRATANDVAEAIREAIASARDTARSTQPGSAGVGREPPRDPAADAFETAASGVAARGFDVKVQRLPPVTASGRVLAPEPQQFDPEFSRAAASLVARGDVSPPVVSSFGVHIIMLLERIPAQHVSEDERRLRLRDEIMAERARAAQAALIERLRREPRVVGGVDVLLELVRTEQ